MQNGIVTEIILTPFGYPHPYKLNFVAQYRFVHQVGEFLVRRDNYQNITGGLAHSWTISTDRKSITFHLRDNLYDANEVKESLSRFIRAGQTSHSNLSAQILSEDSIIVLDKLNVKIQTIGDAGAILAPLVMADMVILPNDHWIKIDGEEQIDWRKLKGPYVYASGSFPLKEGESLIYTPNPKHYFYSEDLPKWKMVFHPVEKFKNLEELKALLEMEPSYTTVRYWDLYQIFYSRNNLKMNFYETRPNGITFLATNRKSEVFKNRNARVTLLKHVTSASFKLMNEKLRAYQIAQPGLSGKMLNEELNEVLNKIKLQPDFQFKKPLVWLCPKGPGENGEWVSELADSTKLPYELKTGLYSDGFGEKWKNGEFDVAVLSVGMSDTDPISGATFLFSPSSLGQDLPNNSILNLLNSAKETTDREHITSTVKKAFRLALEEALIIPISYVTNRHYFSDSVQLNIQDPYSESARIWEIRLKN